MENFSELIRDYLQRKNMTQKELAFLTKIDRARINKILNGVIKPSKNDVIKLKALFENELETKTAE